MRKYVSLSIQELVSDVAVDPVHVRELADSIKSSGPISPVLVREQSLELIDGFHRVGAMKELGFESVECILTPCDDETFWDLRIMSATLHKAVTFARAIDWIDEVFKVSPWAEKYKSPFSLFQQVERGTVPQEGIEWVESKARKWGLSRATIHNWLQTKEGLEPSLLEEVKKGGATQPTDTYIEIGRHLASRPALQKPLIEKAAKEDLSSRQVREVAQALRRAEDEEEVRSILRQPVSRTEEQMVREARVEKLLSQPREITPLEKWQEAKHEDVLYKLDLWTIINSSKAMTPEKISALTPEQKADVYRTCEEAISEIRRVMDMLRPTIRAEYQLKEG